PGAAGLRGRPGAGAAGPRPAGRDGGSRLRRRGDPDRRPGRGRRRPRAREGGGPGERGGGSPGAPPRLALPRRAGDVGPAVRGPELLMTQAVVATPAETAAGIPARWDDLASFVRFLEARGA